MLRTAIPRGTRNWSTRSATRNARQRKAMLNRIARYFRTQFQTFNLLGVYFRSIVQRWHDVLWGASTIAFAFVLWWFLGNPPVWAIALYLVAVMFISGYYAWRADHIRLMPKFEIREFRVQEN